MEEGYQQPKLRREPGHFGSMLDTRMHVVGVRALDLSAACVRGTGEEADELEKTMGTG